MMAAGAVRRVAEMAAAFAVDRAIGDPVRPTHPVRLMGTVIAAYEEAVRRLAFQERSAGAVLAVVLPAGTMWAVGRATGALPRIPATVARVWLLATAFGGRGLADAAWEVEKGLDESPERARESVGMIVGRETGGMTVDEVIRATVETVSENTSDGVVAPMLYGFVGGAPLALAFKAVSTLDSMVGYRNEHYRDLGWASARMDDLANLLPARLTAGVALLVSGSGWSAVRSVREDGRHHDSPNAGLVEAAFAHGLRVRLGGSARYDGRVVVRPPVAREYAPPGREDIRRAVGLSSRVGTATLLAGGAAVLGTAVLGTALCGGGGTRG